MTILLQIPGTGGGGGLALQFAVEPPLYPLHDHVHGPVPDTVLGVPTVQSPVTGAVGRVWLFDDPQTPGTGVGGTIPLQVALHFPG